MELAISAMNNKGCLGDVVNFTCSANANPAVSLYQLFEDDTALLDKNAVGMWNRRFTSGGVYFYKCVANNTMGSIKSKDVRLTVKGNFFEFCQSIFWFSAFCISRCFGKVHFKESVTHPIPYVGTILIKLILFYIYVSKFLKVYGLCACVCLYIIFFF